MKGYSITARPAPTADPLRHSVTDFDRKIVYAPLREDGSDVVRVAGIADLVGFDRRVDERRLAGMTRQAADTVDGGPVATEPKVRFSFSEELLGPNGVAVSHVFVRT